MARNQPLKNIFKIAVLRANALGDFIFALPALEALRKTYPQSEIVYLGKAWHKEFLQGRPSPIDRVEVVPLSKGVGMHDKYEETQEDKKKIEAFFRKMKQEKFDLAIQMHGGGKYSNPFLLNLGAKVTVGSKTDDAKQLDLTIPYIYYHNETLRNLEIVSLAGAYTDNLQPYLSITAQDIIELRNVIGKPHKPYAVLHPGASALQRRWPEDRFAKVGDILAMQGAKIFVTGTSGEEEIVNKVLEHMNRKAESLCGKLSLGGLSALLAQAAVVVSNDTGPLHLARALGCSTVGIYWCGNLINAGPLTIKRHYSFLSWTIVCPLCGKDCTKDYPFDHRFCKHETSFVADVTVEEVAKAAVELYNDQIKKQKGIFKKSRLSDNSYHRQPHLYFRKEQVRK